MLRRLSAFKGSPPNPLDTSSISFTAKYTGAVWVDHGLSPDYFASRQFRLLAKGLDLFDSATHRVVGWSFYEWLLQRHCLIDRLIEEKCKVWGEVQVLELACGLSPRGYRFCTEAPEGLSRYVEADLPGMVDLKRELLGKAKLDSRLHVLTEVNILETDTVHSLETVLQAQFDPSKPLIVVTEGLTPYFNTEVMEVFWGRLVVALKCFPNACYLMDDYSLFKTLPWYPVSKMISKLLGQLTNSSVTLHYDHPDDVEQQFRRMGFDYAKCHNPIDRDDLPTKHPTKDHHVRILEAGIDQA